MTDAMNRRRFLKVLGVTSAGAAAVSACGIGPEPTERLIPYLVQPEDQIPGKATYYATTCRECAAGCGVVARVREGRAVKLEGNPESPINRGRLCARGQAALQGLYNPDRVPHPMVRNANGTFEAIDWDGAIQRLGAKVGEARGKIAFVTGTEVSTFGDLLDDWLKGVGGRRYSYEAFNFDALRAGNRMTFGTTAVPTYDFAHARYLLSFGADFLDTWLSPVEFQNGFTEAHAFDGGRPAGMAKFVFVGPRLSLTGMNADEWIAARPGTEGILALAMAEVIVSQHLTRVPADANRLVGLLAGYAPRAVANTIGIDQDTIVRLAREFARSGGGLAVAGGMATQYANGAEIVAAVNILNYVAGAVGSLVKFGADLAVGSAASFSDFAGLMADMTAGRVALLLVHGANPAHSLPGAFQQALGKVPYKVSFSSYMDETASACDMILPDHHALEQWGDSRPRAGVTAFQQPVVQPVFETRQTADVILKLAGRTGTFKDYIQGKWRGLQPRTHAGGARAGAAANTGDQVLFDALAKGGVYGEAAPPSRPVRLADLSKLNFAAPAVPAAPAALAADQQQVVVFPHPVLHDGRGANKPWLQELPDPVSKIAWHAWVEVHPETAKKWDLATGDFLLLKTARGAGQKFPVWITRSVRSDVLAVPTGQGHTAYGRYAKDRSANAFELLGVQANDYGGRTFMVGASATKTGEHRKIVTTEGSPREGGRGTVEVLGVARARSLRPTDHPFHFEETPSYASPAVEWWSEQQHKMNELGNYKGEHPRWGLAIDLSKCTGCAACVTACYAENNLAAVGEDLMQRGREMSWMRLERYWLTDEKGEPQGAVNTPMLCQQCGNAPCEPVCPVFAAYHTPDGLNGQVYNRCVGTRYCSNNCPYKVRYFNWYNYAERGGKYEAWPEPLSMLLNPDVTVREKGVMEKCTFCVQRIRGAQNQARLEDRGVRDGEIVTACQQTCPSEAIVFGDLNDRRSRVSQLATDPRGYHVLAGLNTKPGITYLARVVAQETPSHG
ncbi:MAG TPA: molybdopterin-dependent oxidoreductase [Gemmatimonadales bacterium]|nr:molybdopterin-dependent oxidoreductase [Gemmatimonadales bacterium]